MKGLLGKGTIREARLAGSSPAEGESAHWLTGLAPNASLMEGTGRRGCIWGLGGGTGSPMLPTSLPPARQGRVRGSGPDALRLTGQPPDGGRSVDHESLRFSFSEQRVSLNCL